MNDDNAINDQGGLIVRAPVFIADEASYNDALDILDADNDIVMADKKAAFNNAHRADFQLEPVHSDSNPIIVDDGRLALLWRDPQDPDNADAMLCVLLKLEDRGDGTYRKTPSAIIAGDQFQGILEYRCPCCGTNQTGFSMLFFIENNNGVIEFDTRDSVETKQGKKRLFEKLDNGIVTSSHDINHILWHHKNDGHCGHDHNRLPGNPAATPKAPKRGFHCN